MTSLQLKFEWQKRLQDEYEQKKELFAHFKRLSTKMKTRKTAPKNAISPDDICMTFLDEESFELENRTAEDGKSIPRWWSLGDQYFQSLNHVNLRSTFSLTGDESDWKLPPTDSLVRYKAKRGLLSKIHSNSVAVPTELNPAHDEYEEPAWAKDVHFEKDELDSAVNRLEKISLDESIISARGKELDTSRIRNHFQRQVRKKRLFKTVSSPAKSLERILEEDENQADRVVVNPMKSEKTQYSLPKKSLTFTVADRENTTMRNPLGISLNNKRDKSKKGGKLLKSCFGGKDGVAALLRAAKNNSLEQCKSLIDRGISTEVIDQRGWTSLYISLEHGRFECAELLTKLCANVNFRNPMKGRTMLHEVASLGNYRAVEFLLGQGADPNIHDAEGWPPLHYALREKHLKCAALLLSSEMDAASYTDKRAKEYKDCVKLAAAGKWRYQWQLDVDLDSKIDL